MNAINVLDVFVVVTLLFQLLAKHNSAGLPCKPVNTYTTPTWLALQLSTCFRCSIIGLNEP